MPRPSTNDSLESAHDLQQRLNPPPPSSSSTATNVPFMIPSQSTIDGLPPTTSSIFPSPDYHPQSTSTRHSDNQFLAMEDKSIQCINNHENSIDEQLSKSMNEYSSIISRKNISFS